jgi:hypothetical protein
MRRDRRGVGGLAVWGRLGAVGRPPAGPLELTSDSSGPSSVASAGVMNSQALPRDPNWPVNPADLLKCPPPVGAARAALLSQCDEHCRRRYGQTSCAQSCSMRWDPVNEQCRYSATCLPCDDVVPEGDPLRVLPW